MDLPPNASRDDILAALRTLPAGDLATRLRLESRLKAIPSAPGIKIRHGAKPGETEVWQDGRWVKEPVMTRARS